jgi:hypothetical protein
VRWRACIAAAAAAAAAAAVPCCGCCCRCISRAPTSHHAVCIEMCVCVAVPRQPASSVLAQPISQRNERAALRSLQGLLRRQLQRLDLGQLQGEQQLLRLQASPSTMDHDQMTGKAGPGSRSSGGGLIRPEFRSAAACFVRGQRALLQRGIAECARRLRAVQHAVTPMNNINKRPRVPAVACSTVLPGGGRACSRRRRRRRRRGSAVTVCEVGRSAAFSVVCGLGPPSQPPGGSALVCAAEVGDGRVVCTASVAAGGCVLRVPEPELLSVASIAAVVGAEWARVLADVGGLDEDAQLLLCLIRLRWQVRQGARDRLVVAESAP